MIKKDDFYSTDTFFNGLVKDRFFSMDRSSRTNRII